jgi:carboxypeptidase Q
MRVTLSCIVALGAVAYASPEDVASDGATSYWYKPLVTSVSLACQFLNNTLTIQLGLQSRVKANALLSHAKALQAIAYNTTGRNRLMGSPGHEGTVDYLYKQLTHPSLGGYYNVTLQPWSGVVQKSGTGSLFVNGKNTSITIGTYSPSGTFRAPLSLANNLGCNEVSDKNRQLDCSLTYRKTDYSKMIPGNIALISRGSCTFAEKSGLAGKMGAVGAIIFNNAPVAIPGMTLDANGTTKFGPVIPTVGISGTEGNALAALIKSGTAVMAALTVKTVIVNVTT